MLLRVCGGLYNMSNIIEENFQCSCASAYLNPESNLFFLSKLTRKKRILPYLSYKFLKNINRRKTTRRNESCFTKWQPN